MDKTFLSFLSGQTKETTSGTLTQSAANKGTALPANGLRDSSVNTNKYIQNPKDVKRKDADNYFYILGISLLPQLRVFRLRHSRMDAEKLLTMMRSLKELKSLETLDFGYDQLQDDCASAFYELFESSASIKNLELESNHLGYEVLSTLGESLQNYSKCHLEYLGLSRNPINDEILHVLISNILGSKHIQALSLRGAIHLTTNGLVCCIANELLRQHSSLIKLDLTGIQISTHAANEIIKALKLNQTMREFEYFGCGLDVGSETDIAVILRRNRYIAENPFVGDHTKTNEEIDDCLNKTRNPILLKVLAEREKFNECLANISQEYKPTLSSMSLDEEDNSELHLTDSDSLTKEDSESFECNFNDLDEKELLEHIALPGPDNRYYYCKNFKAKYMVPDNNKNF